MPTIWTIGYERLRPEMLAAELQAAGVERVIDVRERPQSRKPGMSKSRLTTMLGEHHIRYDYKGYPHTRSRRSLHLFSHLVAVADIYDALTSDRGYRRALLPDMAMRIVLTQSGTAFHPLVVKHFVNLVGLYPVGTFVKLRTGEVALVQYNQNRDLLRPLFLIAGARPRA